MEGVEYILKILELIINDCDSSSIHPLYVNQGVFINLFCTFIYFQTTFTLKIMSFLKIWIAQNNPAKPHLQLETILK